MKHILIAITAITLLCSNVWASGTGTTPTKAAQCDRNDTYKDKFGKVKPCRIEKKKEQEDNDH